MRAQVRGRFGTCRSSHYLPLNFHCLATANQHRRVVALFNKGSSAESVSAPASLYARELVFAGTKVRDVVNKKDVAVAPGTPIVANVPSHGVALFVVTYYNK